jgi:hypothetical protein
MKRVLPLFGSLVLAVSSFAQQTNPTTGTNTYPEGQPNTTYPYSQPVRTSGGNWGFLGLLGLLGLLGARGRQTVITDRDAFTTEQRRRVA